MTSSPTENETDSKQQGVRSKSSDFSIDHILNRAGSSATSENGIEENSDLSTTTVVPFPWLHCTRYCPPKIPRIQKRDGPQKRQLGRHPRIPFTSHQLAVLEEKFHQTPYLSSAEVTKISRSLQLADIRVKIWFQNRRARERRERSLTENERKTGEDLSPVECRSGLENSPSPSTSFIGSLEGNVIPNTNKSSNPKAVPSLFPLLQNYSVNYDIRNVQSYMIDFRNYMDDSD